MKQLLGHELPRRVAEQVLALAVRTFIILTPVVVTRL